MNLAQKSFVDWHTESYIFRQNIPKWLFFNTTLSLAGTCWTFYRKKCLWIKNGFQDLLASLLLLFSFLLCSVKNGFDKTSAGANTISCLKWNFSGAESFFLSFFFLLRLQLISFISLPLSYKEKFRALSHHVFARNCLAKKQQIAETYWLLFTTFIFTVFRIFTEVSWLDR